jgi:AcrR family transcriptional regulator
MTGKKNQKTQTRAERARQTRIRMIDCARQLFLDVGYTATTMEAIAGEAKVAVQTLYYTFRTKGQLLREVVETTAAGQHDAPPVPERPWMQQALSTDSGQRLLALMVEHGVDIYERVAPLWPAVIAAAAADPEVDQYWQGIAAGRRASQRQYAIRLSELEALRPTLDTDRATDLIVVLSGHDTYRGLVLEAGWSLAQYKAWLFTTLVQQLLQRTRLARSAVSDLSFGTALTSS